MQRTSHITRYGLVEDEGESANDNLNRDDDDVLTSGQSLEPYLQSYVDIPPTSDVGNDSFLTSALL